MATNPTDAGREPPAAGAGRDAEKELERELRQAVDEGHDADIPSAAGYVLDEPGELKRRRSIAAQRLAHERGPNGAAADDVESAAGLDKEAGGADAPGDDGQTSDDEANVVWWDGPDDQENPYNWPTWKKVVHCGLISALTFITPLASCKTARSASPAAANADRSSYIRPRRARVDGRVQEFEQGACCVCCFHLRARCKSFTAFSFQPSNLGGREPVIILG